MEHLPRSGSLVEGVLADGASHRLFVKDVVDGTLRLLLPRDDLRARRGAAAQVIELDRLATLAWPLGKYWYVAQVAAVRVGCGEDPCWHVALAGAPQRVNRRRFVRGGGGEVVEIGDPASPAPTVLGEIVDLGEGGVRCRVPQFTGAHGDTVVLALQLGERVLTVAAIVHQVRPAWPTREVELVLHFDGLADAEEQAVRRHVFERELAARRADRNS